jgi:hypothetical protein
MVLGGCAALAVGAFALVETRSGDVAPVIEQSADLAPVIPQTPDRAPTGHQPAVPAPVVRQSADPAHVDSPTRGLQLSQQYGTVCQTPQGSVCTVAPQPINSSCQCGGTYGLIVR